MLQRVSVGGPPSTASWTRRLEEERRKEMQVATITIGAELPNTGVLSLC